MTVETTPVGIPSIVDTSNIVFPVFGVTVEQDCGYTVSMPHMSRVRRPYPSGFGLATKSFAGQVNEVFARQSVLLPRCSAVAALAKSFTAMVKATWAVPLGGASMRICVIALLEILTTRRGSCSEQAGTRVVTARPQRLARMTVSIDHIPLH